MRYVFKAILPGVLLAAGILAIVKLIATGSASGLLHGGWATALNVLGWTLIIILAFAIRAHERNQRIAMRAAEMHEQMLQNRHE